MLKRVVFRVDSAAHIGNGHLYRCLTLADALRAIGCDCLFICRNLPGANTQLIHTKKYPLYKLDTHDIGLVSGNRDTHDTGLGSGNRDTHDTGLVSGNRDTHATGLASDNRDTHDAGWASDNRDTHVTELVSDNRDSHNTESAAVVVGWSEWLGTTVQRDAEQTCGLLSQLTPIDWLVVDNYGLDAGWHSRIRRSGYRLMVIDDLANRRYDCDLLLDQTYGRNQVEYQPWVNQNTRLLIGADYALLRPEFRLSRVAARRRRLDTSAVRRILIAMGGTDPENITVKALSGLQQLARRLPGIEVDIVLGGNAPHLADVQRMVEAMEMTVKLWSNVENMSSLILTADLAIGAAGTSAWERCCLGLPTVLITSADNQKQVAAALSTQGAVMNLGWHRAVSANNIAAAVEQIVIDLRSWKKLSESAFRVCDGKGASQVVKALFPQILAQ